MYPERRPRDDRSPDSLEARLRALPPLPVPAGLEARLLAAVPPSLAPSKPTHSGGWGGTWIAAACGLAAACLLAILLWRGRDVENPAPKRPIDEVVHQHTPRLPEGSASQRALLQARRDLDEAEMPAFSWPFEETSSVRLSISTPYELPN